MRVLPFAGAALALTLAACGSRGSYMAASPPPLQPAPVAPVTGTMLPPPVVGGPQSEVPAPDGQMAAATPDAGGTAPAPGTPTEVRPADMIGGWTIASGGESCQLFTSLTTWSGGYRANTRQCSSDELKGVGAWSVSGKQLTLKDASGATIATLTASAPTRFSGTSSTGRGVQVFR